ncbi:uncharacterized protein [Haliotis cracherodii]|uniref:uncharacterized protein n=1 Tax=Haliotis cracherodii TaxID=6455 RepID=UPI0039EBF4DF
MATSQKLEEHFLTCTICTEVFDNPCTLVCYHTFCRKCVVNYTKTRPEAISAKSLLCPFCSKMTKVSSPEKPVEAWADDVKPSFVIQGLLDSFGPGCKETKNCTCCQAEGETTPANVWCSICDDALCKSCAKAHRRFPATRHHDVLDLSSEVTTIRKRKVMCNEHKDECIKFLCKDCKKATCHTCCVIYHRKCDSVVTLESELPALKSQLLNEKEHIMKKQIQMKVRVDTGKSNVISEKDRYAQMESEIKSSGNKAREKITLKENKLLDELREVSEKHIGQLTADIKSGEISVHMYRQQVELIDQTLLADRDMDLYDMYQGCEVGDVDAVGDAVLKEKGRIARIMFRQDTDQLSRALDDLQLGEIDIQYKGVLDLKATPVLHDTINMRVAGDRKAAKPIDVTALVVNGTDTVVVTDINNESVKSFYTKTKQPGHSKLSLSSSPFGITKLKHNQVAVTVPDTRQIVRVEVNPDLVLLSTITTNKQYWGITSLTQSTLAASVPSSPCVDILDMTGHVLRSINPVHSGKNMLQYPNFLCTTRTGNILVSDYSSMCVLCLTPEGDVVFTYPSTGDTTLTGLRGITSTSTGDILVADNSQHNVVHLTESGHFVRHFLIADDGVYTPCGMATSQKLEENFLTCTICTEVFDNPCTLVCYHTFCRKCVVNYTKTRPEAISAKSLLCPFCSKMTKVSSPEKPLEEWADDVKPSFVIQGLLDSFGPGSKDTKNCACCQREGETIPASVWCSICDDALCDVCESVHRRISSTRHHDTIDLSSEVIITRKRKFMCKEHKNQCIEFLCKDCKKVTCQTCCIIYHRKCDSVVTLESELPALKSQLLNEKNKIIKKQIQMKVKVDTGKSNVISEKDRYAQMESEIKSSGNKAREKITLKENKLLDELREVSEKHIGQLTADIKSGEISVQMYRQQVELIDQTLQSEFDMDVYEMYQGCEVGDVDAVGDAVLKDDGRIARIMFRQDTHQLSRALDDLQLGEIDIQYEGVLDLKVTHGLQNTINITVAGDENTACPFDVTTLVVNGTDTVVVTDYNNKSVKSFYTTTKQPGHSVLSLSSGPLGITKLEHNQVAVTVPDTRQIVTVEVNPDLVLLSTITTNKQYRGITSLTQSTLAASVQFPPSVDILDMTGHVLKSICPVRSGKTILQNPLFLCTTRTGNILVSDSNPRFVLCLTPEGDVVFTYTPTGDTTVTYTRGITSTSTGDILFADSQPKVVHLTESGEFVRNFLTEDDGVLYPCGVCVDGRGRVYVCNHISSEIKVFSSSNTV